MIGHPLWQILSHWSIQFISRFRSIAVEEMLFLFYGHPIIGTGSRIVLTRNSDRDMNVIAMGHENGYKQNSSTILSKDICLSNPNLETECLWRFFQVDCWRYIVALELFFPSGPFPLVQILHRLHHSLTSSLQFMQ